MGKDKRYLLESLLRLEAKKARELQRLAPPDNVIWVSDFNRRQSSSNREEIGKGEVSPLRGPKPRDEL